MDAAVLHVAGAGQRQATTIKYRTVTPELAVRPVSAGANERLESAFRVACEGQAVPASMDVQSVSGPEFCFA